MAVDVWLEYDGREMINIARTARLAEAMGLSPVWVRSGPTAWLQTLLEGPTDPGYGDVTKAPWYDPAFPASAEFAGVIPLGVQGLGDSTAESSPTEYVTNGGAPGLIRNTTLSIVFNVVLAASTERGADYGKRWLDRLLRGRNLTTFCSGSDLRYLRYEAADSPKVHLRDVAMTRATSVTRKVHDSCSALWTVTYTMNAADPFEYGEAEERLADLGSATPTGTGVQSHGTVNLVQESCPVFDYSPIYDPLYPAMVASPTAPDFYPEGWTIDPGDPFVRHWARITPVQPSTLNVVPLVRLTTDVDARMVRIGIWSSDSEVDDQCDPLFLAIASYLPAGVEFTLDAERLAAYVWDGFSAEVRRADSLVYGPEAAPVKWTTFNDESNLLVTLDVFTTAGVPAGDGTVRAAVALVPKSD